MKFEKSDDLYKDIEYQISHTVQTVRTRNDYTTAGVVVGDKNVLRLWVNNPGGMGIEFLGKPEKIMSILRQLANEVEMVANWPDSKEDKS